MSASKSQEVATLDIKALDVLDTTESVLDFFKDLGVDVNDNKADGIKSLDIVDDKDRLIRTPFLIVTWRFNESDSYKNDDGTPGEFVSCEIMLKDGERLVLNDGSTGIRAQLRDLTDHREANNHPTPMAGRFVRKGLRKSEYEYDDKGSKGTTYYLDF